ncbi:MAG: hypothetical protein QG657_139 [Acidobacteriota bacterium]|nr:hypothetical protein [Acidobacteriota bacterium]
MTETKFEQKDCYWMEVDIEKNRLNLYFVGHWGAPEDVPKYTEHVEKAVGMLKPGYTIYAEILDEKPPSLKVTSIHKKGQQIMKDAGVTKTAVYLPKGKMLQRMSLMVVGRLSGMEVKTFATKEEAMAWLEAN